MVKLPVPPSVLSPAFDPLIGNGLLVLTATDVDKSGLSYYGEQNIYYLSTKGDGNMIPLGQWNHTHLIN